MPNYKQMLETKKCAICGNKFQAPSYVELRFCSSTCQKAASKAKYAKECRVCKRPFLTNRVDIAYCSKACSNKSKLLREKGEARKKYRADYRKRPEVVARKRLSDMQPLVLKRKRDYLKRPGAKEQRNKRRREQYKVPEVRQAVRNYQKDWYRKKHHR